MREDGLRLRVGEVAPTPAIALSGLRAALAMLVGVAFATGAGLMAATHGKYLMYACGGLAVVGLVAVMVRWFFPVLLVIFAVRASLDHLRSASSTGILSPAAVVGGLLLVSSTVWLYQRRREGRLAPLSPVAKAFLTLAAVCIFGSLTSSTVFNSFNASLRIFSSALVLIVLEQIYRDRPGRIRPLLIAVFLSIIGPGLVGLGQFLGNKPVAPAYGPPLPVGRIEGTFVHPNAFATYLVLILPLAVAMLPHVHRRLHRLALWAVLMAAATLLLFTYARAAWAAAIVAVVIVGVLQDRRIVAAVLTGVAVGLLTIPSIGARLSDLFKSHPYARTANPNSLSWRFAYWSNVLHLVPRSPVTGVGLDVVQRIEPDGLPPHDVYVQALVESGIVGLAAFVNLVVTAVRSLRGGLQRSYDPLGRSVLVAALASSVGFLIQTFTENLYTQAVSQWYVLVPLAWAATVRSSDATTWAPPAPIGTPEQGPTPLRTPVS